MYEGKEICQMCRKPGSDSPKVKKDTLCWACEKELKILRSTKHQADIKYVRIRQHLYSYKSNAINENLHNTLEAIDNKYAKISNNDSIKNKFGDNNRFYNIDERLVKPLQNLFNECEKQYLELKDELENVPKLVNQRIADEKTRIFNEGLQEGKNLLKQLNNGKITIDQLNEIKPYNDRT